MTATSRTAIISVTLRRLGLGAVVTPGLVIGMSAVARADAKDDQFLVALAAQGIPGDPGQMIAAGHTACDNYGSPALVAQMTASWHRDSPTSRHKT
jgi:hypothetical protein